MDERDDYADLEQPPSVVGDPAALVELIWQLLALAGLGFLIVASVVLFATRLPH